MEQTRNKEDELIIRRYTSTEQCLLDLASTIRFYSCTSLFFFFFFIQHRVTMN